MSVHGARTGPYAPGPMLAHQAAFLDLLLRFEVIRFGEFTLKSGRKSPYFVNAGQLRTGAAIAALGDAYAAHVMHHELRCDLVFGPSYKGVPLAVGTASGLARLGHDVGYAFDRKEAKDHGEGGVFVGTAPGDGMHVVVVDDVITSGQSIREAVALVRGAANVTVSAVVVAVDRQERGRTAKSTLAELRDELGVDVLPIVTIRELADDLCDRPVGDGGRVVLDTARRAEIDAYLAEHGGTA
jgi:orotate phosphoribosyltransferase